MVFVPGIIILTDMLKYGFNTDPAEKEQQQQLQQINCSKKQKPTIIRRFTNIHTPKLETIPEEYEF